MGSRPLSQKGQTLIELVIVSMVAIIIIGALTFAIISSLRNAAFSKNQTLATKLAQDGIERVRSLRDRNGPIKIFGGSGDYEGFDVVWLQSFKSNCLADIGICYFRFDTSKRLEQVTSADKEEIDDVSGDKRFRRFVKMSDESVCEGVSDCHEYQKKVTVVVEWTDFAGVHQSELSTVLRNLNK